MEQRIIELEKKAAFQEHLLEDLNRIVAEQQKAVAELREQLSRFREHAGSGDLREKPEDEAPPPHY